MQLFLLHETENIKKRIKETPQMEFTKTVRQAHLTNIRDVLHTASSLEI